MKEMEKLQAYKILNLNEKNISELEIKKSYRKLILQYHSQKDNSEAIQKQRQEIQEAYELLILEFPIDYRVNLGVLEAEIEQAKKEIKEILESDLDIRKFSFQIERLKIHLKSITDTEKLLFASTPEQSKIYKNWCNQLY